MSDIYLLSAMLVMLIVTFGIRALPALLPRAWLNQPWLHRLNGSLPLVVMVLLVVSSLDIAGWQTGTHALTLANLPNPLDPRWQLFLAQVGALILVLAIYHISRQLLVSIIVGIAAINGLLWLMHTL